MTNKETLLKLSMTELVDLHNSFESKKLHGTQHKPCTLKTFSSKDKIVDRIRFYETCQNTGKKSSDKPKRQTIASFAIALLMDDKGHPYLEVERRVKAHFPGAKTNLNCLRWYATKLREDGKKVPKRASGRTKK